jgi:ferredoxin
VQAAGETGERELIEMRPCFLCAASGWCKHREPEVFRAECEGIRVAAQSALAALEKIGPHKAQTATVKPLVRKATA